MNRKEEIEIKSLTHLNRIMFIDQHQYSKVSDRDKEKWFFIFNQCMSRLLPTHALFLNDKRMDKAMCMDLWFDFLISKKTKSIPNNIYPKWGSKEKKDKKIVIKEKEKELFSVKKLKKKK